VFSEAEAWNDRLKSGVEADAALTALVNRVDLGDSGLRLALQLPLPSADSHTSANAAELVVTRFFPMTIRRRGVEMGLVIRGNGAPAPQADPALLKAEARASRKSLELYKTSQTFDSTSTHRIGLTDWEYQHEDRLT
jgi:hypothetical protein